MSGSAGHHFNLNQSNIFERADDGPDEIFYREPRLVVHVDDHFIAELGRYLEKQLLPGAEILDLMSSYKSHLPAGYKAGKVVGLGLNAVEMKANDQLTDFVVHNLNQDPRLPFPDASFDVVLNTVSIQYLLHPVAIFREIGRVLRPGGQYIVSFSNRMFPTKAVRIWQELAEKERVRLVQQYFEEAGCFEPTELYLQVDRQHHSGSLLAAFFGANDPVYIVSARRSAPAGNP